VTRYRVSVVVRMREDLPEPQGIALEKVLSRMGYQGISNIRVGKVLEMEVEAVDKEKVKDLMDDLSRTLFSNPVIEDYQVLIEDL